MARFAIAGIQMRVSATEDNVATMRRRLATLMAIYPGCGWSSSASWRSAGPCHRPPNPSLDPRKRRSRRWRRSTTSSSFRALCTRVPATTSTTRPRSSTLMGRWSPPQHALRTRLWHALYRSVLSPRPRGGVLLAPPGHPAPVVHGFRGGREDGPLEAIARVLQDENGIVKHRTQQERRPR